MNRLFKYFSIFGILLVFAAYFFRLFEVNGFVRYISQQEDPSVYLKTMGIIYKIDYFFIALIMASCLVSFTLMNKDKKMPLFSVSIIPIGVAILERLYFVVASSIVAKKTMDSDITIVGIVNFVILALGLLSVVNSILVERFLANKHLSFAFSLSSVASITASTLISVYASIINIASIHFILYAIFFLLAAILIAIELILRTHQNKKEDAVDAPSNEA